MYDELIKDLREWPRVCQQYEDSIDQLHDEAADALEELVKALERSKEWETFWEKEANEALKKFQTTVASIPRWIPVSERLPEIRKVVLITDGVDVGTGWMNQGWWDTVFADIQRDAVTHWMPLPEPPKEET